MGIYFCAIPFTLIEQQQATAILQHFHTLKSANICSAPRESCSDQTSQLDILYTSYICIYMQPHLAAPVGVGVSNGRAQSLSGPNCSSDASSAICRCIVVVVVVVPLRATPTPQPAAAATATAAEAQRKLASLCDKSFSSSTTSRGAPTKMRPRFTKEQQQQWKKKRKKKL